MYACMYMHMDIERKKVGSFEFVEKEPMDMDGWYIEEGKKKEIGLYW